MTKEILKLIIAAVLFSSFIVFVKKGCEDQDALHRCIEVCHPRETKAYNIKDKTCVCDKEWSEVKE